MKTRGKQFGKNTKSSEFGLQTHCMQITNNLLDIVQNSPPSDFLFWQGRGQNRVNIVTGWKRGVTNNDHDCCFPPVCSFLVGSGQANIAEISDRFVLNSNNSNDNFSIPIMTMIAVFLLFAPFLSTWLGGQSEGKHCGNIGQFCFIFHFDL